ncbi:hypothetical protein AA313_de0207458 [Arthrobotrys entomopaga]|nr:hypothetical protein AA313_de0207458 [Arthrobotrys entomopaga]
MSTFFKSKQNFSSSDGTPSEAQMIKPEEEMPVQIPVQIPVTCIKPIAVGSHLKNPTIAVICRALGLTDGEYDIVRDALTTAIQNSDILRTVELDINKSSQEDRDAFCNAISNALTSAVPKDSLLLKKLTVLHEDVAPWLIYKLALFRRKKMKNGTKHDGAETTNDELSIINTSFGSVDGTTGPISLEGEGVGILNGDCVAQANPKEGITRQASPEKVTTDQAENTESGANNSTVRGEKKLESSGKVLAAEKRGGASDGEPGRGARENGSPAIKSQTVSKNKKKKKGKNVAAAAVVANTEKEDTIQKTDWAQMAVLAISTMVLFLYAPVAYEIVRGYF